MTAKPAPATVHHARAELLALAARSRPDLDTNELARVLDDQAFTGLGWARTQIETCRVLSNGAADLRDLRKALTSAAQLHRYSRPRNEQQP